MGAEAEHRDQARRNYAFAARLLTQQANDQTCVQWAVIAAFYCAVHCMQAYLLQFGEDPKNHADRGFLIHQQNYRIPADVQDAYYWLKSRSEKARYRLGRFYPSFVQQRVLDDRLETITQFVRLSTTP